MSITVAVYNESNVQETIAKINSHLPAGTVMVNDIKRVTKNFNCKNACDARTYKYLMPTYAMARVADLPLPWHDEDAKDGVVTEDDPAVKEEEKRRHHQAEVEAYEAHEKYRVSQDVLDEANRLLGKYAGAHFYHNFTSGK